VHEKESSMNIEDVIKVFQDRLYLPDPGIVEVMLASVVANRMEGDPVWVLLVGPPASGKTEVLSSLSGLPEVHEMSTITKAGLLSGSASKKEGATGGLLPKVGRYGIVVCKDFTSVLSESSDTRTELLAALREIYDGSWVRHVGGEGGRTIAWQGKVGLLAGVTETIDRHTAAIGAMGERFIFYRLPELNYGGRLEQGRASLENTGHQAEMRAELSSAVAEFLSSIEIPKEMPDLDEEEVERLIMLADLATRCRSSVERSGRDREVELVPQAEAPGRMQAVLVQMARAMKVLKIEKSEIDRLNMKIALDGMPKLRRSVIEHLTGEVASLNPSAALIADAIGIPTATVSRTLEDLAAHRIVERTAARGMGNMWTASEWLINCLLDGSGATHCSPEPSQLGEGTGRRHVAEIPPVGPSK
jgi:hypothetical protein